MEAVEQDTQPSGGGDGKLGKRLRLRNTVLHLVTEAMIIEDAGRHQPSRR